MDLILEELESLKQLMKINNLEKLSEPLQDLYDAVQNAGGSEGRLIEELPEQLFRLISKQNTSGVIIHTSIAISESGRQTWYLNDNYLEDLVNGGLDVQRLSKIDMVMQSIAKPVRLKILVSVYRGNQTFKGIKEHLHIKDGTLAHHLELLLKAKTLQKNGREYVLTPLGTHLMMFALSLSNE